jgi:hypothetical protein
LSSAEKEKEENIGISIYIETSQNKK